MRRRAVRRAFSLTAALALAACGDGGSGGMPGPDPVATLRAPSFLTARGQREQRSLELETNVAATGFQVDLVSDPEVIREIGGIAATGRASGLDLVSFQNVEPGRARLVLLDGSGRALLPAGSGPVLTVTLPIEIFAPQIASPLRLENGLVVDGDGEEFELTLVDGQVTVQ
ncbi:MAG TPA: hypothetical protein VIC56_06715 [Gemmatimonadota bacterium]